MSLKSSLVGDFLMDASHFLVLMYWPLSHSNLRLTIISPSWGLISHRDQIFLYNMLNMNLMDVWLIWCWQVPNAFGCGLGALQLVLYAIYRNNKVDEAKATIVSTRSTTTDETIEMDFGKTLQEKQQLHAPPSLDTHV